MQISGHHFAITGAASGLGAATARLILARGGKVTLLDRNREAGEALVNQMGDHARFAAVDVTDDQGMGDALKKTVEILGPLRGAIACAGIAPSEKVLGKAGMHALSTFERALSINVTGTFNLIRHAAALMAENAPLADGERGILIATASVAAFEGQIGQAAYAASKSAVAGMTLPIARELARSGIRMMTIAPGIFETPMMAGFPDHVQEALGQSVPFPQRLGKPDEYARLAGEIIENSMLNGSVIRLDGALRMAAR